MMGGAEDAPGQAQGRFPGQPGNPGAKNSATALPCLEGLSPAVPQTFCHLRLSSRRELRRRAQLQSAKTAKLGWSVPAGRVAGAASGRASHRHTGAVPQAKADDRRHVIRAAPKNYFGEPPAPSVRVDRKVSRRGTCDRDLDEVAGVCGGRGGAYLSLRVFNGRFAI